MNLESTLTWPLSCPKDGVHLCLSYRCRLTPFELCGGDGLQSEFSSEDRISFTYHTEGEFEEPITHIGWRGGDSTLSVETVHTYPNEGQGVRSESTFELS